MRVREMPAMMAGRASQPDRTRAKMSMDVWRLKLTNLAAGGPQPHRTRNPCRYMCIPVVGHVTRGDVQLHGHLWEA